MPTVGVVIPLFHSSAYVVGCLRSVLAQTRPVDQIVLVDDRGTDDSVAVATGYLTDEHRDFHLITQPRNGGLGRARNTGLAALETDLVWFLDSDDQAEPEFVARLTDALVTHDAGFAVTRTQRVDDQGTVLQIDEATMPDSWLSGSAYARELLRGRAKGYACTKLFRREILGDTPWAQDQAYEDIATSLRLALATDRVALIDDPLYRYLYREGSLSTALTKGTLDLFIVDSAVTQLVSQASERTSAWDTDLVGYRYREVLTSVAHVAMRADHAQLERPALYEPALRRVRQSISMRDLPTLWRGGYRREMIFAVLVKYVPWFYSAVLRWR